MARTPVFIEVKDSSGNVVPAASINIKKRSNGADATLYNAETAGSVIANPTIADSLGRVSVWIDRGDYNAFVTGTGISPYTVPIDAGPTGDAEIDLTWLPASVQSLVVGGNTVTRQTGGALPVSPVDGDRVIYTADATNGVTWEFLYRSASASIYKWELIGGSELSAFVDTAQTTASLTFAVLATAGPSITVPLAGDYYIEVGSEQFSNTATSVQLHSFDVGGTAAIDDDSAISSAPATTEPYSVNKRRRKTVAAASTAIVSKYRVNGGTGTFRFRTMYVRPIRVA